MNERDEFQRIARLFEAARSMRPEERETYLREACAKRPGDLAEVRALFEHHDEDDLSLAVADPPSRIEGATRETAALPDRIGRYRIKRRLGVGGMAIVYLAEQERPQREVAVKVIRPGRVTHELLKRFELEAMLLGRLKHPGIAHILEAGTHDDGSGEQPFFAMEFVDGRPLRDHANEHELGLRARLALVARVADAVDHAHRSGIVHRDLKPGNILVDATGSPKVLDFGVARATASDLEVSTLHTDHGQLIGTLAYMSPEQVTGNADAIDARSDVYALGVVLYELICDRLPYDLENRTVAVAARMISEDDPTPMTTVHRSYRGDLDTIVRKALEKDPRRRYASAAELAADIRRYLNDEPIVARPATTWYQLRKFARRHRGLVAGAAAALLMLVAGVVVSTVFAIRQTHALRESELQRSIAEAVATFLEDDIIEAIDPRHAPDREITLREALDRATERIEGRFRNAPLVEANLRKTLGQAYRNLFRNADAERQLTRALQLYERELGPRHERALLCRMELVAVAMELRTGDGIEDAIRELLELQQETLGDDHEQTIASRHNLGTAFANAGKLDEAESILREALEQRRRVLGEKDEHTATTLQNLAQVYGYRGEDDRAKAMLIEALATLREVSGDDHPQTLQTLHNLGAIHYRLREFDQAVPILEQALEGYRRVMTEDHPETLVVASTLAIVYGAAGRQRDRIALLEETYPIQQRLRGDDHVDTLTTRMALARVAFDRRAYEAAESEYADISRRMTTYYPDHFLGWAAGTMQGRCLERLGRLEDAESVLLRSFDALSTKLGADHERARETASALMNVYKRLGRPAEAKRWRDRLRNSTEAGD